MRDEDFNRMYIEHYIAQARQERAQAIRRWAIRAVTRLRNAWVAMWGIRRKIAGEPR